MKRLEVDSNATKYLKVEFKGIDGWYSSDVYKKLLPFVQE
jgi:hypothetical protein